MSERFWILSLDGGGLRGTYAARLLYDIEKEFGISWTNKFDLIAGTSTGSIIAGALAVGKTAEDVFQLYKELGPCVFHRRWPSRIIPGALRALVQSRYKMDALRQALEKNLGDIRLGEITAPLLIPAVDVALGQVHVFKSRYQESYVRDGNVRVVDAIIASCSAPTYFDPHRVAKLRLADGG